MSKDPGSSQTGEVFQEAYECEVITWKISNVSSLEITKSTEIRSQIFYYAKATWVLKMFPCGEEDSDGKFSIKIHLERLDSEIPIHNYSCRYFFKRDNSNVECFLRYRPVKFDSNSKENKIPDFMYCKFWYDMFYHHRSYRLNDTIILVVEILTEKNTTIEFGSETNLTDTILGPEFEKTSQSLKSVGDLLIESFNVNAIAWKIAKIPSIPVEVDNRVQSLAFSFAGVSWILKLFLCGQTEFQSEGVDVVIERLPCLNQKHALSYELLFKSYDEYKSSMKDYYNEMHLNCARGSFIFDSDHTQENLLNIKSYKEFLEYATPIEQFGTAVLVCELRIPKETEIRINFPMKSLQSFKDFLPLKTENIRKAEIGEIIKKSFECEVISWTIPSFSSLLTAECKAVRSPQFSYKGAIWILEIYRNSHRKDFTKVIMKRLNSHLPVLNFFYRSFFKEHGGEPFFYKPGSSISLGSNAEEGHVIWSYGVKHFYLYNKCRCNDILTFECELYTEKISGIGMDFKSKSFKEALGNINLESGDSRKSVGELFIETFEVEMITWQIPKARSLPTEVDYGVQSPSFLFSGASWSLEMFPYGQKKFESETNVDIVIERTFSLFPKHAVSYRMYFEDAKNTFDEGYSFEDFVMMLGCSTRGSFIFESNSPKENVCCVKSYSDFFNLIAPNRPSDTVFLVCDFRLKNSDGTNRNIQRKLSKSSTGSSEKKSEPTVASLVSSSKDSPEEKSDQSPMSYFSSFKESLEKKSEQKFNFKGADSVPRESIDLPNKKLLRDLKDLFLKQEDCDVVFNVRGQEFSAHRLILKARSSVFASTFRNGMKEKATGVVDIEDCDPSSFSDFLYFLYCGSTEKLSSENVFSLFTTADKYDVQDLRSVCLKFMRKNLSEDTFCDTIALALQHSERELIELATDFFSKNLQKIILTVKWQSFLVKNPIQGNELLIKALAPNE